MDTKPVTYDFADVQLFTIIVAGVSEAAFSLKATRIRASEALIDGYACGTEILLIV
ncbi:hypothetical protein ACTXT7_015277 [Hymenolepis weldensis]